MAGTVGSGSTMEYEYNSTDQHGPQPTPTYRCPVMAGYLNEHPISPVSSYLGHGVHDHRQGPSDGNNSTNYSHNRSSTRVRHSPHHPESPFRFTPSSSWTQLPPPNVHLPAPTRPYQNVASAPTHYSGHSRPAFESINVLGSPVQSANPHPTPPVDVGSTTLRVSDIPSISSPASSQADSSSSSSTQSAAPASQSESTQRQGQSSFGLPSVATVQLPLPSNSRQRLSGDRRAQALSTFARYRELSTPEYEALHAAATQSSNEDRDNARYRYFGYYAERGESQILRGRYDGKRVASKKAVQSLEKVDVSSLEDTEKSM